jgi:predicted transcriptional regulator
MKSHSGLSRRERQIIDILYQKGKATAQEVMDGMADAPGYSAVRSHLATLEEKGHVRHEKDGAKYVFIPKLRPEKAKQSEIRRLIRTFFGGSREQAVAALLDVSPQEFSEEELDRLAELIEKARKGKNDDNSR